MKWVLDLFDLYGRRARAYPALVVLAPAIIAYVTTAPTLSPGASTAAGGTAVLVALFFAFTQGVRFAGARIQDRLWDKWGGPPSTRLVLWSDSSLSDEWKQVVHETVQAALSIRLLSREEEEAEPDRARKLIVDAFRQVKTVLRLKASKTEYQIHNAEYGFARNLLGSCPVGLVMSVLALLWSAGVCWWLENTLAGVGAVGCLVLAVAFHIAQKHWLPAHANRSANWYAEKAWTTFVEVNRQSSGENR